MQLPEPFLQRMESELGPDGFRAYLSAMEEAPKRSGRVNTLKLAPEAFAALTGRPVKDGAFTAEETLSPGTDLFHAAGLYYMQESSARYPVSLFSLQEGMCVLDLCAAPGGKSGQLAAGLKGTGLLVSNELVPNRAKILESNLERLGVTNAVITNMDAEALVNRTGAVFDAVLVDAPCAGEGMFRKDPDAVRDWSEAHVSSCAVRQRKLLMTAREAVKPGGELVYSTCSFSPAENRETVRYFLEQAPDFTLISEKTLYPHTSEGEGQYAALLKRAGERIPTPLTPVAAKKCPVFESFRSALAPLPAGTVQTLKDGRVLLVPPLPDPEFLTGLKLIRAGLLLGEEEKGRFTPSHALALAAGPLIKNTVALTKEEAEKYMRGETLPTACEGWCAVTYEGYALGLGKGAARILKNHLPKGLRIRK